VQAAADDHQYEQAVRKAMWQPSVYRISAAQTEYMGEKRQRLTVRTVMPVDWVAESKHLIAKMAKA
jgi:replication factor A1